jgi:hypothetical protein
MKQTQKLSQEQKEIVLETINNRSVGLSDEGHYRDVNVLRRAYRTLLNSDGDLNKLTKAQLRLVEEVVASRLVRESDAIQEYGDDGSDYVKELQNLVNVLDSVYRVLRGE